MLWGWSNISLSLSQDVIKFLSFVCNYFILFFSSLEILVLRILIVPGCDVLIVYFSLFLFTTYPQYR